MQNSAGVAMDFATISGAGGAKVPDIDLERERTRERVGALTTGLGEHGVPACRGRSLSPEGRLAADGASGAVSVDRFFEAAGVRPGIAGARRELEPKVNIGGDRHTGHACDTGPAAGSVLVARQGRPVVGDSGSPACMPLATLSRTG